MTVDQIANPSTYRAVFEDMNDGESVSVRFLLNGVAR